MAQHLRRTLLAGLFAVLPLAVTVYVVVQVEQQLRLVMGRVLGEFLPPWLLALVALVLIVSVVYTVGLLVTNVVGQWFLRQFDKVLSKVPVLRELYVAWRQVSYAPGGGEGMFAKVALVPCDGAGPARVLGLSDGVVRADDLVAIFVPNTPNVVTGRLLFVPADRVTYLDVPVEDVFKALISTGNFLPELRTSS